jgi:hypothetical protein
MEERTMLMNDRRITSLRPEFQPIARAWVQMMGILLPLRGLAGYTAIIAETLRDTATQEALHEAGATDVKLGWHNVGLAFDFAIITPTQTVVTDGTHLAYQAGINIGQALGCHCPIILANGKPDYDHIEWHPGFTLQQFLNGVKLGVVTR